MNSYDKISGILWWITWSFHLYIFYQYFINQSNNRHFPNTVTIWNLTKLKTSRIEILKEQVYKKALGINVTPKRIFISQNFTIFSTNLFFLGLARRIWSCLYITFLMKKLPLKTGSHILYRRQLASLYSDPKNWDTCGTRMW